MTIKKLLIRVNDIRKVHAIHYLSEKDLNNETLIKNPLVIICHGFTGDKKEWGRFPQTAESLNKEGFDALLFDFSGSGENTREPVLLSKQVEDLEEVYKWAHHIGYTEISVIGLSFGGLTLLYANLPNIKTNIFWAPAFYIDKIIGKFRIKLIKILIRIGIKQLKLKSSGKGGKIIINTNFIDEILNVQSNERIEKLDKPTLIIQGTEDKDVKPEFTREAYFHIPDIIDHKLIEIEGTDHEFNGKFLERFIDFSIEWLKMYL
ncbi:MAG: alpha/beta hydrolase [Promethearchaeati archaeon]